MNLKLKKYIKEDLGVTQAKAAKQLGISRVHLNNIINGLVPGQGLAKKIQSWSDGKIKAVVLLHLET